MKTPSLCQILAALGLASLALHAAGSTPGLLGRPTTATAATPVPETTLLHAITDDGRRVLLTSASERLVAGDGNRASDVLLVDLQSGQATLVSAGPEAAPVAGASIAVGMAADAAQVALLTRSRALAPGATAAGWNLLVRTTDTGTWTPVALATPATGPLGTAVDAVLSADGRHVFFASPDRTLAPGTLAIGRNVYRHDLVAAETRAVTAGLPPTLGTPTRVVSFTPTPDGLAATLDLEVRINNVSRLEVAFRDFVTGTTRHASAKPPPGLGTGTVYHSAGVASPDRRFVAWRSESSTGTLRYHGLNLFDATTGLSALLNIRTNEPARQTFPAGAHRAGFSADGRFLAYAAPLPGDFTASGSRTNGPSQIYLHDLSLDQTILVSAAPGGAAANADARDPQITADGRGVVFTSAASNLVPGADTPVPRLYWWDRVSATLQVITILDDTPAGGGPVLSPSGNWIAWLTVSDPETPVVHTWNTLTATAASRALPPTATQSSSGPGWVGIQPAGVSADGRFVAIAAPATAAAAPGGHVQVQWIDTRSGTITTLSEGTDGQPANGHSLAPAISADGSRVLFVSAAANLVSGDANRAADAFVLDMTDSGRRMLRTAVVPPSAPALWDALLSPDGRHAYVRFAETTAQIRARFADAAAGTLSAPLPGHLHSLPAFSRDGRRLAVSISATSSANTAAVQIHDPAAWLAAGNNTVPALWVSEMRALEPVLDADGSRVAFILTSPPTATSNRVVLVDWAAGQTVFSQIINRTPFSAPRLSDDGRFVAWLAPGGLSNALNQVWLADAANGTVRQISVAPDGITPANGNCRHVEISADGRYVTFASLADNLVPDDTNGAKDVFLHDTLTGQTLLLSRTPSGDPGNGWSLQPFFSADGHSLFFLSLASDLAPDDYNQALDLLKIEILPGAGLLQVLRRNVLTGRAELLWSVSAGRSYAIEFKDDIEAAWTRLPGQFTGEAPVDLDPTAASRRFFRVVELP